MQDNGNITKIKRQRPAKEQTQEQRDRREKRKGWERTDKRQQQF
jgi:hypothetical protein